MLVFYTCFFRQRKSAWGLTLPLLLQKIIFPFGTAVASCSALCVFGCTGVFFAAISYYGQVILAVSKGNDIPFQRLWISASCLFVLLLAIGALVDLCIEWRHEKKKSGAKAVFSLLFNLLLLLTGLFIVVFVGFILLAPYI